MKLAYQNPATIVRSNFEFDDQEKKIVLALRVEDRRGKRHRVLVPDEVTERLLHGYQAPEILEHRELQIDSDGKVENWDTAIEILSRNAALESKHAQACLTQLQQEVGPELWSVENAKFGRLPESNKPGLCLSVINAWPRRDGIKRQIWLSELETLQVLSLEQLKEPFTLQNKILTLKEGKPTLLTPAQMEQYEQVFDSERFARSEVKLGDEKDFTFDNQRVRTATKGVTYVPNSSADFYRQGKSRGQHAIMLQDGKESLVLTCTSSAGSLLTHEILKTLQANQPNWKEAILTRFKDLGVDLGPLPAVAPLTREQQERNVLWGEDMGISAATIIAALGSTEPIREAAKTYLGKFGAGTPSDSGDFGRCHRLLEQFPDWKARLPEVGKAFPRTDWDKLASKWNSIDKQFEAGKHEKVYESLKELSADRLGLPGMT